MARNKPVIHILSGKCLLNYVTIYKNNNKLSAAQITQRTMMGSLMNIKDMEGCGHGLLRRTISALVLSD
jgi:hypothetical protein